MEPEPEQQFETEIETESEPDWSWLEEADKRLWIETNTDKGGLPVDATQLLGGRFLRKEDYLKPALMTIARAAPENVAMKGEPQKNRMVVSFNEAQKGMVVGPQFLVTVIEMMGTKDTDQWIGRKVVIYNDPNIMMGTEKKGGLRFRLPRNKTPAPEQMSRPAPAPLPQTYEEDAPVTDDDIPW